MGIERNTEEKESPREKPKETLNPHSHPIYRHREMIVLSEYIFNFTLREPNGVCFLLRYVVYMNTNKSL